MYIICYIGIYFVCYIEMILDEKMIINPFHSIVLILSILTWTTSSGSFLRNEVKWNWIFPSFCTIKRMAWTSLFLRNSHRWCNCMAKAIPSPIDQLRTRNAILLVSICCCNDIKFHYLQLTELQLRWIKCYYPIRAWLISMEMIRGIIYFDDQ